MPQEQSYPGDVSRETLSLEPAISDLVNTPALLTSRQVNQEVG